MAQYRWGDYNYEHPVSYQDVVIVRLTNVNTYTAIVGDSIFESVCDTMIFIKGLYFDNSDNLSSVIKTAEKLEYKHATSLATGIYSMTRAVDVFIPIFELISIFLYIGVIFILMNFSSKMINDKMHEIGILKALGTKNGTIGIVFGLQVMLIAFLTCGLSTLGYFLFIDVANDILVESIRSIAPSWTLPNLQFLTFKSMIAFENCILIFALAFVSLIFPMIKIKAIKPVKIIKAKE
jgi:ABC-type antimicrobial peptide transport system permease subunit